MDVTKYCVYEPLDGSHFTVTYLDDLDVMREEYGPGFDADHKIVAHENFTAEHLVAIAEDELENENYHSLSSLPSSFLAELKGRSALSESDQRIVLQVLVTTLFKNL